MRRRCGSSGISASHNKSTTRKTKHIEEDEEEGDDDDDAPRLTLAPSSLRKRPRGDDDASEKPSEVPCRHFFRKTGDSSGLKRHETPKKGRVEENAGSQVAMLMVRCDPKKGVVKACVNVAGAKSVFVTLGKKVKNAEENKLKSLGIDDCQVANDTKTKPAEPLEHEGRHGGLAVEGCRSYEGGAQEYIGQHGQPRGPCTADGQSRWLLPLARPPGGQANRNGEKSAIEWLIKKMCSGG